MPAISELSTTLEPTTSVTQSETVQPNTETTFGKKGVWTVIGRGDDAALEAYAQSIGTHSRGMKSVLDNESITSKEVLFFDVTEGLDEYIDPDVPMLIGQVTKTIGTQLKGFTLEGPQRLVLASFTMRTKLTVPDENGVSYGARPVLFALFPDATPGLRSASGSISQATTYRPGLRVMITHYSDDKKSPLFARFNISPRAMHGIVDKAEFALQLPEYIYGAAMNAGATKEELCVSSELRADIETAKRLEELLGGPSAAPAPRRNFSRSELS